MATEEKYLASLGGTAIVKELTFQEVGAAGTYTGSVTLPAGSTLIDIIVHNTALWTAGTSALMDVGDVADPNGYFAGIDLKATDLLATESVSFDNAGGKAGADIANSQVNRRYLATERVISGVITTVGTTATTGRTRMTVVYSCPQGTNVTPATYAAT